MHLGLPLGQLLHEGLKGLNVVPASLHVFIGFLEGNRTCHYCTA